MITRRVAGFDGGKKTGWSVLDVPMHAHELPVFVACGILDRSRRAEEAGEIIRRYGVELVGLERVLNVHPKDGGIGASMASHLLRAAEITGEIRNEARHCGCPVNWCQAREWRKVIVGKANAEPARITAAIKLRIPGWPRVSNGHERDGGGVALWTGLTAEIREWAVDKAEEEDEQEKKHVRLAARGPLGRARSVGGRQVGLFGPGGRG